MNFYARPLYTVILYLSSIIFIGGYFLGSNGFILPGEFGLLLGCFWLILAIKQSFPVVQVFDDEILIAKPYWGYHQYNISEIETFDFINDTKLELIINGEFIPIAKLSDISLELLEKELNKLKENKNS